MIFKSLIPNPFFQTTQSGIRVIGSNIEEEFGSGETATTTKFCWVIYRQQLQTNTC